MKGNNRIVSLGLSLVVLNGCSFSLADCIRSRDATQTSKNLSVPVPKGCSSDGALIGGIQAISSNDGRVGYAVPAISQPRLGTQIQ